MDDRAIKETLGSLGGRGMILGRCPFCARPVTAGHERLKVGPGRYAHARCASVHGLFTTRPQPRNTAARRR